jgi:sulfonate transport system ATP-binding protein
MRLHDTGITYQLYSVLPGYGLSYAEVWSIYQQEYLMSISAINARNQFRGTVTEIIRGPVLSEVDVETAAGIVTSVITSRSIDALNIKIGDEVVAVFKSTEVLLAKP